MNVHYIDEKEAALLKRLSEKLIENELSVGTAESCTGGRIASLFTSMPEISDHFIGGIVAYSEEIKKSLLQVPAGDIEKFSVVSRPVAEGMARGTARVVECACALATTGFAGPDGGTDENPVGTVWIAVLVKDRVRSERFVFSGDRQEVVRQSSFQALRMLEDMLAG